MTIKDDGRLARLLMLGVGLFLGGGLFILMSVFGGILIKGPAMPLLGGMGMLSVLAGVGCAGYALYLGLSKETGATGATITEIPDCKISARFLISSVGEQLFNEDDLVDEDLTAKYYIRMNTPDGKAWELKCHPETWRFCGEGMRGSAQVQGDWLGKFVPLAITGAAPPEGNPYRS
jgi:hypothetical protein